MKLVLFLDGVSCVGKTTISHKSVDFIKYRDSYSGFAKKHDLSHMNALYDQIVLNDIFDYLDDIVHKTQLNKLEQLLTAYQSYDTVDGISFSKDFHNTSGASNINHHCQRTNDTNNHSKDTAMSSDDHDDRTNRTCNDGNIKSLQNLKLDDNDDDNTIKNIPSTIITNSTINTVAATVNMMTTTTTTPPTPTLTSSTNTTTNTTNNCIKIFNNIDDIPEDDENDEKDIDDDDDDDNDDDDDDDDDDDSYTSIEDDQDNNNNNNNNNDDDNGDNDDGNGDDDDDFNGKYKNNNVVKKLNDFITKSLKFNNVNDIDGNTDTTNTTDTIINNVQFKKETIESDAHHIIADNERNNAKVEQQSLLTKTLNSVSNDSEMQHAPLFLTKCRNAVNNPMLALINEYQSKQSCECGHPIKQYTYNIHANHVDVKRIHRAQQESMYSAMLTKPSEPIIIDRSMFSSFAYNLLFQYDGDSVEPKAFRNRLEREVFSDAKFCEILTKVWQSWMRRLDVLYPTLRIEIFWLIPYDIEGVIKNIERRGAFDRNFTNLSYYIQNQSYIFTKLATITGVGQLVNIQNFITRELLEDYVAVSNYQYSSKINNRMINL